MVANFTTSSIYSIVLDAIQLNLTVTIDELTFYYTITVNEIYAIAICHKVENMSPKVSWDVKMNINVQIKHEH